MSETSLPSLEEATSQLTGPDQMFEIESVEIRGRSLRTWKNSPSSIRDLWEQCRAFGERDYLVYEDQRLTYEDAFQRSVTLALVLVDRYKIKKGERVAIAMRNYLEWPIAFWAAASIGAVVVPLNAWWKRQELEYGLDDSRASLLIADEARANLIAPGLNERSLRGILVAQADGSLPEGCAAFPETMAGPDATLPQVPIAPDDEATIFYTSGTTGNPKGALGTQRNFCNNLMSTGFANTIWAVRLGMEIPGPDDEGTPYTQLMSVPFFHVTGCHGTLANITASGNKLVMMHKWDAERALELIEREKINGFGGVPSMVWQVLESPNFRTRDTSSLISVSYGGAPAAPELVRRVVEEFGEDSPSQGYGMTETSAMVTVISGEDYQRKPDSVGQPVPVCQVKVIDENGQTLPPGQIGELCIYGPNVVKGYWNNPEASAETFRDGWCHSGDIARIDEEGFVFLVDRAKDMIIRGGENVYCVEVENALFTHPEVTDAAVVGIPDRILGEEVGAVIQVRSQATLSEEALRHYLSERLAAFKVPCRIEMLREPLPRNANGKILKAELKLRFIAADTPSR